MADLTDAEHGAQVRARLAAAPGGAWFSARAVLSHPAFDGRDANLIANAPTDLARLLDRAERAERERDEAKANLRAVKDYSEEWARDDSTTHSQCVYAVGVLARLAAPLRLPALGSNSQ